MPDKELAKELREFWLSCESRLLEELKNKTQTPPTPPKLDTAFIRDMVGYLGGQKFLDDNPDMKRLSQRILGNYMLDQSDVSLSVQMPNMPNRIAYPLSDFLKEKLGKYPGMAQVINFGKLVAIEYRAERGTNPEKRQQFVNGETRSVNSYTSDDKYIMERAFTKLHSIPQGQ